MKKYQIKMKAAMTANGVLGIGLALPWPFGTQKADMADFRKSTLNCPVIMGRKTIESMNWKPLKDRHNIYISRTAPDFVLPEGLEWQPDISTAIQRAVEVVKENGTIWIIGGGEIYRQYMETVAISEIEITIIDKQVPPNKDNVVFPIGQLHQEFEKVKSEDFKADEKNDYPYTFMVFRNKNLLKAGELKHPKADDNGWIRYPESKPENYGTYEVFREKADKQHYETWNNTGWAYNNNDISHYRKIIKPSN